MIIVGLLLLLQEPLIAGRHSLLAVLALIAFPFLALAYIGRSYKNRRLIAGIAACWTLGLVIVFVRDAFSPPNGGSWYEIINLKMLLVTAAYRSQFVLIAAVALVSLFIKKRYIGILIGVVLGLIVGRTIALLINYPDEFPPCCTEAFHYTLLRAYYIPSVVGILLGLDLGTVQSYYPSVFRKWPVWAAVVAIASAGIGYRVYDVQSGWYRTFAPQEVVEDASLANLIHLMDTSPNESMRLSAIERFLGLGPFRDNPEFDMANRALIRRLSDPYPAVRINAVQLLETLPGEDSVQALTKALDDKDANVRMWAAVSLGHIGSTAAVPALLAHVEGYKINDEVICALGDIRDKSVIPTLLRLARNPKMFGPVAYALGTIKDKKALPYLIGELESDNPDRFHGATFAIAEIAGSKVAVSLLKRRLSSKSSDVRLEVVRALGCYIHDDEHLKAVLSRVAQSDSDQRVRQLAKYVLSPAP